MAGARQGANQCKAYVHCTCTKTSEVTEHTSVLELLNDMSLYSKTGFMSVAVHKGTQGRLASLCRFRELRRDYTARTTIVRCKRKGVRYESVSVETISGTVLPTLFEYEQKEKKDEVGRRVG